MGIKIHAGVRLFSVLISIFLLCTSGCGKKEAIPKETMVKVAFWGSPDEIEIITQSIAPWQAQHPEIKVRFEHTPFGGYVSKILTRIAGGAAPDVICTEVNYFVSFAAKNVLENLNPFIEKDAAFDKNAFFPEVMDRFTVDGRLLAIPRDTAPFACVFYNKDLFDQAAVPYPTDDWTWEELLEKAKQLTLRDSSGRVTQYGFYGWAWKNFVYGNGGALVDHVKKPTKTLLDEPKAMEGLGFYVDLINKYKVMPTPVALTNMGMGIDIMFSTGKLAMFLSGIWETPALRQRKFNWDVAMFPKNSQGIRHFGTGGSGYCILKSSKHKEASWEVVKALTGAKGQAELAQRGLAQPALISVAEGPDWAANTAPPANKKMLNEAVRYVIYDPFSPIWQEIEGKYLIEELDLLFNGRITVEEAMKKIVPKINEALASESAA
ncbi:MAG: sugar ABC transporter substrate-binding protein [Candidatus Omnitrophica bacterium]|nr:sugar ABC transporter substrate-binding protein [Candidatus Omnitrophota bacterium]